MENLGIIVAAGLVYFGWRRSYSQLKRVFANIAGAIALFTVIVTALDLVTSALLNP